MFGTKSKQLFRPGWHCKGMIGKYAQNQRMLLGQGPAEFKQGLNCDCGNEPCKPTNITNRSLSSNHHFYHDNVCHNLPIVYVDDCSFHCEDLVQAGVGIVWQDRSVQEPQQHKLGPKTSQYAEVDNVLVVLQQATQGQH